MRRFLIFISAFTLLFGCSHLERTSLNKDHIVNCLLNNALLNGLLLLMTLFFGYTLPLNFFLLAALLFNSLFLGLFLLTTLLLG